MWHSAAILDWMIYILLHVPIHSVAILLDSSFFCFLLLERRFKQPVSTTTCLFGTPEGRFERPVRRLPVYYSSMVPRTAAAAQDCVTECRVFLPEKDESELGSVARYGIN